MDGRKLAPASRSEGVILNYSDLLVGGSKSQEDLGACLLARHVAVSPSNLRATLPLLSTPTAVSALPPEMDGQASGMRNLLGAGQINLQSGI